MAQSNKEIAKEMMIAWLSNNPFKAVNADETGKYIGQAYNTILETIGGEGPPAASVSIEPDTPPERRRRTR